MVQDAPPLIRPTAHYTHDFSYSFLPSDTPERMSNNSSFFFQRYKTPSDDLQPKGKLREHVGGGGCGGPRLEPRAGVETSGLGGWPAGTGT